MGRFRVVWSRQAAGSLATIWSDAVNRQSIADAANAVDRELSYDPALRGKALAEGLRVLETPPLRIIFEVSDADHTARIVGVRALSQR